MLGKERQNRIYRKIATEGRASISELAKELNVSVETVRRDIKLMDQQHLLEQVHGGAVALNTAFMRRNLELSKRKQKDMEERRLITARACTYLQPGDVIAINAGLTAEELVKVLPGNYGLTVFLTSVTALELLIGRIISHTFDGRVFVLGGFVDTFDMCCSGPSVRAQISSYHFDKVFISPTSVTTEGLMLSSESEGVDSEVLMGQSSKVYCLATSAKVGAPSLYVFSPLNALDVFITDSVHPLSQGFTDALGKAAVSLDVCKKETPAEV